MSHRKIISTACGFFVMLPAMAAATTGEVVLSFPSSFPSPDGLAWDGTNLWATDCSFSRIDKLDPTTGDVIGSIEVEGILSDELAWDGTSLWLSDHTKTEMPNMEAPPPAIYRIDPATGDVLQSFLAPSPKKFPMGVAWTGSSLWNVDLAEKKIFELDPSTGAVLRSIPSPPKGGCGLNWDGACLWLTDASKDGFVYHIDPDSGEVISSFQGPGGPGHMYTGVAWDGEYLWVTDEAVDKAAVYKVVIDDPTEGGRCSPGGGDGGAGGNGSAGDGGAAPSGDHAGSSETAENEEESGCAMSASPRSGTGALLVAVGFGTLALLRGRRVRGREGGASRASRYSGAQKREEVR